MLKDVKNLIEKLSIKKSLIEKEIGLLKQVQKLEEERQLLSTSTGGPINSVRENVEVVERKDPITVPGQQIKKHPKLQMPLKELAPIIKGYLENPMPSIELEKVLLEEHDLQWKDFHRTIIRLNEIMDEKICHYKLNDVWHYKIN